jgi:uncharacterized protein (DUF1697 family)
MAIHYCAFLRGINVGGHTVKMDHLRAMLTELGLANVRTYIQTGNVFFEAPDTVMNGASTLQSQIEAHLEKELGYAVPTFVRTVKEVEETVKQAPFDTLELTPDTRHMIVFLSAPLPKDTTFPLRSPKGDFEVVGTNNKDAYVVIHLLNGRVESSNFLEKTFHVTTTGRFYHTTRKILDSVLKIE